jgi:excisionase family DNA binding protein
MDKWKRANGESGNTSLPIRSSSDRTAVAVKSRVFENLSTPIDASYNAFHLITKEQLAQQLALSPSYISKLMSEEGLPYIKIGRAVRFRPKEVVEWLTERKMP